MTQAGYLKRVVVGLATLAVSTSVALAPGAAEAAPSGPASASPSPPTLTVTPSTNLVDLQTVHLAGHHFPAGATIATIECIKGATGSQGCDLGTLMTTPADSSGSFTFDRYVRRIISILSSPFDCAKAPGACIMGAADYSDLSAAASAPLSFNPKVPPKQATVTATPSTGLVDHQLIKLVGGGVVPNNFVQVTECAPGPLVPGSCDYSTQASVVTGPAGGFYLSWPVHRLLLLSAASTGPDIVDCATVAGHCQAIAGDLNGPGGGTSIAVAPLSFNRQVPPVSQKLFVFPHINVVDKQLLTVSGNGFTPGATITAVVCRAGATSQNDCDISSYRTTTAGFVGHFEMKMAVHRSIFTASGPLDCASAPGACVLTAVDASRYVIEHASVALSFNPNAPPPPVTLTVMPSTHLIDDQAVAVRGTGLTPLGPVTVSECSAGLVNGVPTPFCTNSAYTTADAKGDIITSYFVHSVIQGPRGLVGCRAKPGLCFIALTEAYNIAPEAQAALSFA
jgi:hypothetical protein